MKNWKPEEIRKIISEKLPEGRVIPRHTEKGHFYEINEGSHPIYPSVTAKLHVLKDEGLMNYKMNRAIEYVFGNYKNFTDANVMEQLEIASRVSQDIMVAAGDVGTTVHNLREEIFNEWIKTGERPDDFLKFIKPEQEDIRVISAIRALQKFCIEREYIPVVCELLVYNHKYEVAGTLDDIGLIKKVLHEGVGFCGQIGPDGTQQENHNIMKSEKTGKYTCLACGYQYRYEFCLMDLKTSNAFKDHYFFQVSLYSWMFKDLIGLKPERLFILKVSKEDGTYRIEDIREPTKLAIYSKHMLKTNEGIEFIKKLRKDNQKVVAPLMQL